MVRLLNGTLMRILFTLWQTVACDPHYLCAGALSAPVLSLWGWSGPRAPVHCYCCGACREASATRHMRRIACRDTQTPRQCE